MFTIFKREVKAYFHSPIAYVFIGAFFVLAGIFFMVANILSGNGSFGGTLDSMKLIMLFVIPALVMKLIAEEKKTKTDQLLFTSPVSMTSIVLGKYFAACVVFFITLVISISYNIILFYLAKPPMPELLTAYLGFLLLGMSFIAICIFASSVTDNQIIAFLLGFASILTLWLIQFVGNSVTNKIASNAIDWLSLLKRYEDFAGGVLKPASILYYISIIALFIFLTIRALEKRRYN